MFASDDAFFSSRLRAHVFTMWDRRSSFRTNVTVKFDCQMSIKICFKNETFLSFVKIVLAKMYHLTHVSVLVCLFTIIFIETHNTTLNYNKQDIKGVVSKDTWISLLCINISCPEKK